MGTVLALALLVCAPARSASANAPSESVKAELEKVLTAHIRKQADSDEGLGFYELEDSVAGRQWFLQFERIDAIQDLGGQRYRVRVRFREAGTAEEERAPDSPKGMPVTVDFTLSKAKKGWKILSETISSVNGKPRARTTAP